MNIRKAPTLLAFVFILITLARVSHFASVHLQAGVLGPVFALGMGLAVFLASSNTREHITIREGAKEDRRSRNARMVAWGLLVLSVLAEGLFNLADTLSALGETPAPHILLGAYVYGVYPTLLVAGFGMLQGYLDRLPTPPAKHTLDWHRIIASVYARALDAIEKPTPAPITKPSKPVINPVVHEAKENVSIPVLHPMQGLLATCRACGWESNKTYATKKAKSNALAAHTRACKGRKNGKVKAHKHAAGILNGASHKETEK